MPPSSSARVKSEAVSLLEGKRSSEEYNQFTMELVKNNQQLKQNFESKFILDSKVGYKEGVKTKIYTDRSEYEGGFISNEDSK